MPRIARKDLNTSYIHVMVQGVNKEYIFDEEKFLKKYLQAMKENIDEKNFELLAYCMMNNHAHFLFWVGDFKKFEKYMHKNNLIFAQEYNKAKERYGVVFRNRYRIEPIYDMNHLKNCIRYIHENPVKAKIVEKCEEYPYSSYNDYRSNTGVANSNIMKELFGENFDYNSIFENTFERSFIDVESVASPKEYVGFGIAEFIKRSHYDLIQVFSEKEILVELVCFLKNECNVLYKEIRDYFGISRGMFDYMIKNK